MGLTPEGVNTQWDQYLMELIPNGINTKPVALVANYG
jgi:hypothetical protein